MHEIRVNWEGVIGPMDPCILLGARTNLPKIDGACALVICSDDHSASLLSSDDDVQLAVELAPGGGDFMVKISSHPRVVIIEPGADETSEPYVYFANIRPSIHRSIPA